MQILHACGQPFNNPDPNPKGDTIRRITACVHGFHDEGLIEDGMLTAASTKQLTKALADGKLFDKQDADLLEKSKGFLKDTRIALLDARHQLIQLALAYVGRVSDEDRGDGAKFGSALIRDSFLRALPAAYWDCKICKEFWSSSAFNKAGERVADFGSWNGLFATSIVRLVTAKGWWNHTAGQGFKGRINDLEGPKSNSAESFAQAQPGDIVVWSRKCSFQSLLLRFDPKEDTLLTVDADSRSQAVTVAVRKRSSAEGWICTVDCLAPNQPAMLVEQAYRTPTAQELQKCVSEPVPAACQVQPSKLDEASKQSQSDKEKEATAGKKKKKEEEAGAEDKDEQAEGSEGSGTDTKTDGAKGAEDKKEEAAASSKAKSEESGSKEGQPPPPSPKKPRRKRTKRAPSESSGSGASGSSGSSGSSGGRPIKRRSKAKPRHSQSRSQSGSSSQSVSPSSA